jgi:hypothetical protein
MADDPLISAAAAEVPPGFQRAGEGLIVPAGSVGELPRVRFDWDDAKHIVRAYQVARRQQLLLIVGCNDHRCAENPAIQKIDTEDGGFVWQCGHLVRVISTGPRGGRWKPR